MNSKILFTLTLAVFLLAACTSAGALPLGDTTLAVGQSVSDGIVTVTFVRVLDDSRCAADAICIWAGQVNILLRVSVGSETTDYTLTLGQMLEGNVSSISVGEYTFTLTEVNPYPLASDPTDPADYNVTLNIGR